MDREQTAALKWVEQKRNEGKISPVMAHSINNSIGAGMATFREQYPDIASQIPAPKSTVNKLQMPAAPSK